MSSETISTTESVTKEEINSTNPVYSNEGLESSTTNGSYYSNENNNHVEQQEQKYDPQQQQQQQQQQSEQQLEQEYQKDDVDSSKNTYDDQEQQTYNKNDLEPESFRKVFIGGLSYKTEDDAFKEYFSKYGDIVVIENIQMKSIKSACFFFCKFN